VLENKERFVKSLAFRNPQLGFRRFWGVFWNFLQIGDAKRRNFGVLRLNQNPPFMVESRKASH
jgi:hypothetical protein